MNSRAILNLWDVPALAPATLLLLPFLANGTIGLLFAAFGVAVIPGLAGARTLALAMVAVIAVQALLGVASLVCWWVLVLGAAPRISQRPHRRWMAVSLLAVGEAAAAYFLFASDQRVFREITTSFWSVALWSAALALPMLLGLRYLVLLLRPGRKEQES